MTWRTTFLFVLFATLLTTLVGWLTMAEVLPIQQSIHYSDSGRKFIQIWLWVAIALGLLLPSLAWVAWIRNSQPRRILGFYLVVLAIQIATERVSSTVGIPSLVMTVGTVYTAFRIWQLWQGQQLIHQEAWSSLNQRLLNTLLRLLWLFWVSNLIMLLTLGWSSVLSQKSIS